VTGLTLLAAVLLVSSSAALLVPGSPDRRLLRVLPGPSSRPPAHDRRRWATYVAAAAAAVGAVVAVGGSTGLVLGAAVLVVAPRLLGRLESRHDRQRREDAQRQAPLVADLLASTLTGGVPVTAAVRAVADCTALDVVRATEGVVAALELGASPEDAWRACPAELSPVAQAAVRSARTGAPLSVLLRRIADDLARDRRRSVEVAARSAGVRAVGPLAACFLPAFLLVGVVPVVVSLASSLL